ncbi:MAG: Gfo/Idh/MocA family oxidoreductase [Candidatus Binataceae bacterium]|nr:Gfo/Idh/MocA family oxidoreductase [Candidatus Binataceae bacterium]
MTELRAAVIGVGKLGTLHASKYAAIPDVRLVAVVDVDQSRASQIALEYGAAAVTDFRTLKGTVDLVSVATPSLTHYEVAAWMLQAGIDVLLEKPMAASPAHARELVALAAAHGRILQIGHLERFNPAIVHLRSMLRAPRFIESHRLAPFTERGTDVDVILDLMTHDLDVILSCTEAEVISAEAVGVAVLTDRIDVANARLRFSNGLIANLNTSRVAPRRERKIRFFQPDEYISVDYEARRIQVYRKGAPQPGSPYPVISAEQINLDKGDQLADEIAAFVASVRSRQAPIVSAADGLRVMELTDRIKSVMESAGTIAQ